jgi:cytochrome c-type biogenesis protein CcmH
VRSLRFGPIRIPNTNPPVNGPKLPANPLLPINEQIMKKLFWLIPVVLVLSALWAGVAFAQDPTPSDDDVNRVAKQLFCPVCENTPLDVCPTQACAQWRALIREKLAAGWTEAQIKQYFVDQYGARVLSEPPRTGLNWLVYIVPPILFVVGVIILIRTFMPSKESAGAEAPPASTDEMPLPPASSSDEYVARMEDELKKRK